MFDVSYELHKGRGNNEVRNSGFRVSICFNHSVFRKLCFNPRKKHDDRGLHQTILVYGLWGMVLKGRVVSHSLVQEASLSHTSADAILHTSVRTDPSPPYTPEDPGITCRRRMIVCMFIGAQHAVNGVSTNLPVCVFGLKDRAIGAKETGPVVWARHPFMNLYARGAPDRSTVGGR